MESIVPVILCGGSGTRLWPLSRAERPKQFLPLVGERSLFQETVLRARGVSDALPQPLVICNSSHRFLVAEQLREVGVTAQAIVLEPAGRNTAPAVGVAALLAARADAAPPVGAAADPLLLVLPADHVVLNTAAFTAAVRAAAPAAAQGYLVTFGIVPDRPETGYGYLLRGRDLGHCAALDEFVEKPDLTTARAYVDSGKYLWNSGMFLFSAAAYLRELATHALPIAQACERAVAEAAVGEDFVRLGAAFTDCPSDSIDYAVMEKTSRAAVVSLDAGWSDVGSWPALHDVLMKDANGNSVVGDVFAESCSGSYVAAHSRFVACLGLTNVVVVETSDAVLVMAREQAQSVKKVVDAWQAAERSEVADAKE